MKYFVAGIWILIDKINIPIIQSCSWKLCDGYIQGSSGKYRDKLLHRIIAEKAGLDMSNEIDHKDGDRVNNLLSNLRPATHSQNQMNSKAYSNNTSGYKGVTWCKKLKKWQARIQINGIRNHLGYFNTAKEAYAAYCQAAKIYHREFARL